MDRLLKRNVKWCDPRPFFIPWGSSGMAPNYKTFRAPSKLKWFSDKSMYKAKLVTGGSELVEPVKDGSLQWRLGNIEQWY